jgi:uncharacterized membrane protein YkvA (DUF1232 family)
MGNDERIAQLEQMAPAVANHLILFQRFAKLLLRLFRDSRVPRYLKVLTAGVVTYVALPFDVLPEFAPLTGKGEDLLVVFLVLVQYLKRCPEDVLREHWEATMGDPSEAEARLREAAAAIEPVVSKRFTSLDETIRNIAGRISPPAPDVP